MTFGAGLGTPKGRMLFDHVHKQVTVKIVYYGAGLGGKSTNLRQVKRLSRPDRCGKLVAVNTPAKRTLFFDLLPLELGKLRGYTIHTHLCSVPGQIAQDRTRQLVLNNTDGVVLVVDAQAERLEANEQSITDLDDNLRLVGIDPDRLPTVVQYNKRDLSGALTPDQLRAALEISPDITQIEASARTGWGVFETLKAVSKQTLQLIGQPSLRPQGRVKCPLQEPRPFLVRRPAESMIVELKPRDDRATAGGRGA